MAFLEAVIAEGELFFFAYVDLSSAGGDDKSAFVCIDEQLLACDLAIVLGLVILDFELRDAVPHREFCRVVLEQFVYNLQDAELFPVSEVEYQVWGSVFESYLEVILSTCCLLEMYSTMLSFMAAFTIFLFSLSMLIDC